MRQPALCENLGTLKGGGIDDVVAAIINTEMSNRE
jgi:hypothetical protein